MKQHERLKSGMWNCYNTKINPASIRHGRRWFHAEATFLLCKNSTLNNIHGRTLFNRVSVKIWGRLKSGRWKTGHTFVSILKRLFRKPFEKMRRIYFVAAHKLVLDLSEAAWAIVRRWKADKLMNSLTKQVGRLAVFRGFLFLFLNGKRCSANTVKGASHTVLPLYGCRFSKVFHTDLLRVCLSNL